MMLICYIRLQIGLELVDPTQAAGLAGAWEEALGSNGAPVSRAVPAYVLQKDLILFSHPWPSPHCRTTLHASSA